VPPGLAELVDQVLAYTKFNVDPKRPAAGDTLTFETVPGIMPAMPADVTGSSTGGSIAGQPLGPLNLVLNSIVRPVRFRVQYVLTVNGTVVAAPAITPLTGGNLPDSGPLMGLLRVPPVLVPEHQATPTVPATFTARVTVGIEGVEQTRDITVPLTLAAVPVPELLVLQADPNDEDWPSNKTFILTRVGTQLSDAGEIIASLNNVIQVLNATGDLLGLTGAVLGTTVQGFRDTINMITRTGFVIAGIANEEAPDLDDYNDFDDEARSSILLGRVGTKVSFFSGEDYNALVGGEDEVSTFEITQDFGAAATPAPITTGFGIHRVPDWRSRMWDTDSSDNMDDCESCKFVS
jgi:hypothetical protein